MYSEIPALFVILGLLSVIFCDDDYPIVLLYIIIKTFFNMLDVRQYVRQIM